MGQSNQEHGFDKLIVAMYHVHHKATQAEIGRAIQWVITDLAIAGEVERVSGEPVVLASAQVVQQIRDLRPDAPMDTLVYLSMLEALCDLTLKEALWVIRQMWRLWGPAKPGRAGGK